MTQEEKAKAYDEALERAKEFQKSKDGLCVLTAESIFPQLKESEEERIRKALIEVFKKKLERGFEWVEYGIPNRSVLDWLEKQKGQKLSATINGETIPTENYSVDIPLAEWSEEDETAFGDLMWCIKQAAKSAKDENDMGNVWFAENWVKNRLKSLRPQPKQEWSEEDEDTINLMIAILRENYSNCLFKTNSANTTRMSAISTDMLIKRIEALHPQSKAEWSEEDKAHRDFILESLEDQIRFCKKDAEGAHYAKQIRTAQNWLKSLPGRFNFEPKQEWSDEEYGRLFDIEHYLDGTLQLSSDRRIACIDFLKSLCALQ